MQKRKESGLYRIQDDTPEVPHHSMLTDHGEGGAIHNPAYAEEKSRLWLNELKKHLNFECILTYTCTSIYAIFILVNRSCGQGEYILYKKKNQLLIPFMNLILWSMTIKKIKRHNFYHFCLMQKCVYLIAGYLHVFNMADKCLPTDIIPITWRLFW